MNFTIRYNRTSVHIQGCEAATQTTGDGEDNGSGVVAYYAESACGSLTRNGYRMAVGESYETAAEARDAAQAKAKSLGLKFCKNCETAVKWAVANAPFDPESDEFKAEKKRVNDELIARSEAAKTKRAAQETKPERTHADAVAQMRANIDAEEETRAAARRARNRTNYAPTPEPAEAAVRTERKARTFTFEYNATEGAWVQPDDETDDGYFTPKHFARIDFDTAYGYRGENGETCSTLHVQLMTRVGKWLDEQSVPWKWRDEFTGKIHAAYDSFDTFGKW
jgi:hypothetical protein